MPRNYRIERDAVIRRWYGGNSQPVNPKPRRSWVDGPITQSDCLGIPTPVNSPFTLYGHCMVWKYSLNRGGYGTLIVEGKQELAHRAAFIQTRGQSLEEKQVNHLCNRPYCVQPSHLYAGTTQDNKDDSQIFNKDQLLHAPWILHLSAGGDTKDPFLRRLLESNRYDGTEPWEPVEQPAQKSLEEFTCPKHDFSITMLGGESRICRICETSESQEREGDELGTYSLIAEICPVSQTVVSIFRKILASEFVGESYHETRRRAYYRNRQGPGMGSHCLRSCGCSYCTQDRKAFRAAIEPHLTTEESNLLDVCDRLEPLITNALQEASAEMMEEWAKALGLNNGQTQVLREHYKDCTSTKAEFIRTSRTLERELGYLLYALVEYNTREELLRDETFLQIIYGWNLARVRKGDQKQLQRTILPAAEVTANRMAAAWERETAEVTQPYRESKPDLIRDMRWLAQVLAKKQVVEHLRFELLGRNSFGEQEPHPHSYCATSIVATERVRSFPRQFEEGIGYSPREQ